MWVASRLMIKLLFLYWSQFGSEISSPKFVCPSIHLSVTFWHENTLHIYFEEHIKLSSWILGSVLHYEVCSFQFLVKILIFCPSFMFKIFFKNYKVFKAFFHTFLTGFSLEIALQTGEDNEQSTRTLVYLLIHIIYILIITSIRDCCFLGI